MRVVGPQHPLAHRGWNRLRTRWNGHSIEKWKRPWSAIWSFFSFIYFPDREAITSLNRFRNFNWIIVCFSNADGSSGNLPAGCCLLPKQQQRLPVYRYCFLLWSWPICSARHLPPTLFQPAQWPGFRSPCIQALWLRHWVFDKTDRLGRKIVRQV